MVMAGAANPLSAAPFSELVEQARTLQQGGQLKKALQTIDRALEQQRSPAALATKARILAADSQPRQALEVFEETARGAKRGSAYWRIGLFGSARMHIWLGQYDAAQTDYQTLLHDELSDADRPVAQAGLIKALTLQNRPRYAYRQVVDPNQVTSDRIHHALARAALWAGWDERAWQHLEAIREPPSPQNWRGKDLAELRSQIERRRANPLNLQYDYYDDSDQLQSHTWTVTAERRIDAGLSLSARLGVERFLQDGQRVTARRAKLGAEGRLNSDLTYTARVGIGDYGTWTTPLWSGELTYRPNDQWGLQGFAAREVVETFTSFEQRNRFTLMGAAYDFKLHDRWVAAVVPYLQDFSDGNLRKALRARLVGTVSEHNGIIAEFEGRHFTDSNTDTQGYFNPDTFSDIRVSLRWRQRHARWTYELSAGPGYQWIEPGEDNATVLLEGRLRGPLSDSLYLEARAGYSDAAADTSGEFSHRYATVQLARPW